MPHHDAGMRIEPPPSVPSAKVRRPSATAAAQPPEEPPVFRLVSNGLRLGPQSGLAAPPREPMTGLLPVPTGIAPACSARSANAQYVSSLKSRSAGMPPNVAGHPGLKSNRSLIAAGTPCNRPTASPLSNAPSASSAAARASSKPRYTSAFKLGLRASMRSIVASSTSTGDSSRRRTRPASSTTVMYASSSASDTRAPLVPDTHSLKASRSGVKASGEADSERADGLRRDARDERARRDVLGDDR